LTGSSNATASGNLTALNSGQQWTLPDLVNVLAVFALKLSLPYSLITVHALGNTTV
jgi:hypothetical protein